MKTETLRKYELMIIVDAKLTNEERETIRREAADIAAKAGAKIINSQTWIEKQKLSFPIRKCSEGTYFLINFEGEGAAIGTIRSNLRLNERILRSAVTKVE